VERMEADEDAQGEERDAPGKLHEQRHAQGEAQKGEGAEARSSTEASASTNVRGRKWARTGMVMGAATMSTCSQGIRRLVRFYFSPTGSTRRTASGKLREAAQC
jgi:hypothetical protein